MFITWIKVYEKGNSFDSLINKRNAVKASGSSNTPASETCCKEKEMKRCLCY